MFLAFCLFSPDSTILAEDSLWQKAITEGRQLRAQGRYTEAENAFRSVLAAETSGSEDHRVAITLNELAVLYHA